LPPKKGRKQQSQALTKADSSGEVLEREKKAKGTKGTIQHCDSCKISIVKKRTCQVAGISPAGKGCRVGGVVFIVYKSF